MNQYYFTPCNPTCEHYDRSKACNPQCERKVRYLEVKKAIVDERKSKELYNDFKSEAIRYTNVMRKNKRKGM